MSSSSMKDKIINFIEKYDNIIVILVFFIPILAISIKNNITINDEIWNFQNAYKMYNGFQIYKDCNVIVTPIFFYIAQLFFKIIGGNILAFRIYNAVLFEIFFFMIYQIFKNLKIKKINSLIYTIILFFLYGRYIFTGANYNILSVIFCMIGICLIQKFKNKKYYNIFQGIIIYLIIFTKQNIGFLYLIGIIAVEFFENWNSKKQAIKNLAKQLIIVAFLGIFTITIMLYQGILFDFINYCFLGINEFAERNFVIEQGNEPTIIKIIITGIAIYIVTAFLIKKEIINFDTKEEKKNLIILLIMAIPINFKIYPILNSYHTIFGFLFTFIIMLYLLDKVMLNNVMKKADAEYICILIILIFGLVYNFYGIMSLNSNKSNFSKGHPYYGSAKDEKFEEKLEEVLTYIDERENEGKNVIFLSGDSCLYMIPKRKNNGKFDLPFVGNLGKDGKEGLINEIKEFDDNTLILIDKENPFWQIPQDVREYIILNWRKIDEINDYYVMENSLLNKYY